MPLWCPKGHLVQRALLHLMPNERPHPARLSVTPAEFAPRAPDGRSRLIVGASGVSAGVQNVCSQMSSV